MAQCQEVGHPYIVLMLLKNKKKSKDSSKNQNKLLVESYQKRKRKAQISTVGGKFGTAPKYLSASQIVDFET